MITHIPYGLYNWLLSVRTFSGCDANTYFSLPTPKMIPNDMLFKNWYRRHNAHVKQVPLSRLAFSLYLWLAQVNMTKYFLDNNQVIKLMIVTNFYKPTLM